MTRLALPALLALAGSLHAGATCDLARGGTLAGAAAAAGVSVADLAAANQEVLRGREPPTTVLGDDGVRRLRLRLPGQRRGRSRRRTRNRRSEPSNLAGAAATPDRTASRTKDRGLAGFLRGFLDALASLFGGFRGAGIASAGAAARRWNFPTRVVSRPDPVSTGSSFGQGGTAGKGGGTSGAAGGGNGSRGGGSGAVAPGDRSFAQVLPVGGQYRITTEFNDGTENNSSGKKRSGRRHGGIDVAAHIPGRADLIDGRPTVSVGPGFVSKSYNSVSYGNVVFVDHLDAAGAQVGFQTRYAHLQTGTKVGEGRRLAAGEAVGRVGNTGNSRGAHLHFEVLQGSARNSADGAGALFDYSSKLDPRFFLQF